MRNHEKASQLTGQLISQAVQDVAGHDEDVAPARPAPCRSTLGWWLKQVRKMGSSVHIMKYRLHISSWWVAPARTTCAALRESKSQVACSFSPARHAA